MRTKQGGFILKKTLLILAFAALTVFMFGCEHNKNEAETTTVNHYSHIAEFEEQYGLVSMPSGNYTIGTINPESNLSEQGIFRKTDNGYELVVNFGVIRGDGFWENDSYFLIMGNTLTEYPLSAKDPYNSSKTVILLPNMADIKGVVRFDEENIYVNATLWDEINGRSHKAKYYKISRDGASYEEIDYADIPTDK